MVVEYPAALEHAMQRLFESLDERARRLYAAIEAQKLGHGGIAYIAQLLQYDRKTIRRGIQELRHNAEPLAPGRARKKGAVESPS